MGGALGGWCIGWAVHRVGGALGRWCIGWVVHRVGASAKEGRGEDVKRGQGVRSKGEPLTCCEAIDVCLVSARIVTTARGMSTVSAHFWTICTAKTMRP